MQSTSMKSSIATSVVYEIVIAKVATEFQSLPLPVRDVLKLCDGTRSPAAICAAISPAERTRRILGRLVALGLIAPRPPSPSLVRAPAIARWLAGAPLEDPAFSTEEEQFFARSIDHLVADD
jgi:hypothetical protein